MDKKYMGLIGLCLSILCLSVYIGFGRVTQPTSTENDILGHVEYHSSVCASVFPKDGGEIFLGCKENTLTNTGKNYIKTSMGLGTVNNVTQLVLGNTTAPAAASTVLASNYTGCGLAPANGAYNTNGDGNWSIAYTWTSLCDANVVNTTALYKTSAEIFAGTSFSATTLYTDDQLKVNYTVWVS